jgi:hypothetical protein
MTTNNEYPIKPASGDLFDRVASILEEAQANMMRAVNSHMVIAYWLIGREIVQALQGGDERAEYGKEVVKQHFLSVDRKIRQGIFNHQSLVFQAVLPRFFRPPPGDSPQPLWRIRLGQKTPQALWRIPSQNGDWWRDH